MAITGLVKTCIFEYCNKYSIVDIDTDIYSFITLIVLIYSFIEDTNFVLQIVFLKTISIYRMFNQFSLCNQHFYQKISLD